MRKITLLLTFVSFVITSCELTKKSGQKNNAPYLYLIASGQVRPANYADNKKYINDHQVIKIIILTDSDVTKLNKILSSDSLTLKDNHRSCLFFPTYALKWPNGKIMLVSLSPCPKIQTIEKADSNAAVNDLRDKSELEQWMKRF